jgi:y4mF family transcriptional regulator
MVNDFVREKRKQAGLTQPELAAKAGVGLRFVRELEQGKETLRLDKINQVLQLFGFRMGPVDQRKNYSMNAEPGRFEITGVETEMPIRRDKR